MTRFCIVIWALLVCGSVAQPDLANATSPIDKVVALIKEMKEQCVKDGEDDTEAYDKYKCWCITTEKEKKEAIEAAEAKIEELNSFLEEAAAKEAQLKTEIAGLEEDIAKDKEALANAKALREKENEAFLAEEADLKETLSLLAEAIEVLQKVQFTQKPSKQVLLQLRKIVSRVSPKFHNVMEKDLYDMLGSLESLESEHLGAVFLPKNRAAALEQQWRREGSLPWAERHKSDEAIGKDAKPNELHGMAAGAKSYNARSGSILGILKAMGDQTARDLADAQKEELQAEIDFQNLQAAKIGEIRSATKQKDQKEVELADIIRKTAEAKEDLEKTTKAKEEDEKFLANMLKECAEEDEEYQKRVKVRADEVTALSETLQILTGDEARSLFDKTISFVQLDAVSEATISARQEGMKNSAMQRILSTARKHKSWALAGLALRVKLDAFTKVKEMMDKMHAELAAQQKAEVEKRDTCNTDIDETEDKIKEGMNEKEDLDQKHTELTNELEQLASDIATLKKEVADMEVALKQAGEQRKAENGLFQESVNNQRATIQILHMAQARLQEFYAGGVITAETTPAPVAQLVQIKEHKAPPPPKSSETNAYEHTGNSGGVMQMLSTIVADAESVEIELKLTEQNQQKNYAEFVADTTASIEADRDAIAEKEKRTSEAEGEKSETEEAQLQNDEELAKLNELLTGIHAECDYVLKYFDIRQRARADEMSAIEEAKAILSGAKFS